MGFERLWEWPITSIRLWGPTRRLWPYSPQCAWKTPLLRRKPKLCWTKHSPRGRTTPRLWSKRQNCSVCTTCHTFLKQHVHFIIWFSQTNCAAKVKSNILRCIKKMSMEIKVSFSCEGREQKYEEGIALLRNALANQSDCVLHRMLGDFLVAVNDYQEAMDQYSIALRWSWRITCSKSIIWSHFVTTSLTVCLFVSLKSRPQRPEVFRRHAEDGEGGESHRRHGGTGRRRHGGQRGGRRSGGQRQRSSSVGWSGTVVWYAVTPATEGYTVRSTCWHTTACQNLLNKHSDNLWATSLWSLLVYTALQSSLRENQHIDYSMFVKKKKK